MSIKYNVIIQKEDDWYVAKCIDNNVASQGKNKDEALKNLREAIELYYSEIELNIKETEKHMRGDIINKLRKSEEEIENGEGIDSDVAFKELRQKYGY